MFTGLVEATGRVAAIEAKGGDVRLRIASDTLGFADVQLGDSIAVNGVCLTVVAFDAHSFDADVSTETLARTTLGAWTVGRLVNLEKSLRFGDRVGGHLVSGHVDGVGQVGYFGEEAVGGVGGGGNVGHWWLLVGGNKIDNSV